MAGLKNLNALSAARAKTELLRCCGSAAWAEKMLRARPFADEDQLFKTAEVIWRELAREDWLEAFSHHPKIGDKKHLKAKFKSTRQWAGAEQAGVDHAEDAVLDALAEGNRRYEDKFGYIFIVCATGKSAPEMLELLNRRLGNDRQSELIIAADEQRKIVRLRLEKLLTS